MNALAARRFWRPRFRLATLFWLTLAAALAFGWRTDRQRLQQLHERTLERALEASHVEHEIRIAAITREGWIGLWPDDADLPRHSAEARRMSARLPWRGPIEVADDVVRRRYSQFLSAPDLVAAFEVAKADDELLGRGFRRHWPFFRVWPTIAEDSRLNELAPRTVPQVDPEKDNPDIQLLLEDPAAVCRLVVQFEQFPSRFDAQFSEQIAALFDSHNELYCAIGAREISKKSPPGEAASTFFRAYQAEDDVFRRELLACLYLGQRELDGE